MLLAIKSFALRHIPCLLFSVDDAFSVD